MNKAVPFYGPAHGGPLKDMVFYEENETQYWGRCPTSIMVLGKEAPGIISSRLWLIHSLHIPYSCIRSNMGIVQNVDSGTSNPKILIQQV